MKIKDKTITIDELVRCISKKMCVNCYSTIKFNFTIPLCSNCRDVFINDGETK